MTTDKNMIVPFEIKQDDIQETGIFKGYGAVFGNKDSHHDIMMPGAFTKTLLKGGRNGTGVAMLKQHDSRKPIGIWTMLAEDNKGLRVEGQLAMKTQDGQETYELMKMGALKGLSVGFDTIIDEYDSKKKVRYLKEVDLWEVSPVTFGANLKAQITSVKKIDIERIKEAKTERELEGALREVEGLSECSAKLLVKMCKPFLREAVKANDGIKDTMLDAILGSLKSVNQQIVDGNMTDILNSLKRINP